jgi:hypothetical protein
MITVDLIERGKALLVDAIEAGDRGHPLDRIQAQFTKLACQVGVTAFATAVRDDFSIRIARALAANGKKSFDDLLPEVTGRDRIRSAPLLQHPQARSVAEAPWASLTISISSL